MHISAPVDLFLLFISDKTYASSKSILMTFIIKSGVYKSWDARHCYAYDRHVQLPSNNSHTKAVGPTITAQAAKHTLNGTGIIKDMHHFPKY